MRSGLRGVWREAARIMVAEVQRYGVARVIARAKRGPSMPAVGEVLEELASQCDLVITGSGD